MFNSMLQIEESVILQSRRKTQGKLVCQDSKVQPLSPSLLPITTALEMYFKEKGVFKPRTKKDYRDHTRYLQEWALEEGYSISTMADFSVMLVKEYRSYMLEEFSRSTVNIRLRTLRAFLAWAKERGYTEELSSYLKPVKVEDNGVHFLRDNEIRLLLSGVDQGCYEGFRDYLLIIIMLDCGIRISELLAVTWEMVNFEDNCIGLPGRITKNGKFRNVPLSGTTTVPLLRRLFIQNQAKFPGKNHLFLSYLGNPIQASTVRHSFRNYAHALGIEKLSPHMLRHTFARNYVRSGGNVFALMEILGHSSLDISRRYVQLFSKEIAEEHQVMSPVDKFVG